jgi:hypothetical protein
MSTFGIVERRPHLKRDRPASVACACQLAPHVMTIGRADRTHPRDGIPCDLRKRTQVTETTGLFGRAPATPKTAPALASLVE